MLQHVLPLLPTLSTLEHSQVNFLVYITEKNFRIYMTAPSVLYVLDGSGNLFQSSWSCWVVLLKIKSPWPNSQCLHLHWLKKKSRSTHMHKTKKIIFTLTNYKKDVQVCCAGFAKVMVWISWIRLLQTTHSQSIYYVFHNLKSTQPLYVKEVDTTLAPALEEGGIMEKQRQKIPSSWPSLSSLHNTLGLFVPLASSSTPHLNHSQELNLFLQYHETNQQKSKSRAVMEAFK